MRAFLGMVLAVLLCCPSVLVVSGSGYTDVTVAEAQSMVDSDPFLVVLDVRIQSEYDSGHIRNAKLIPLAELEGRLNELNKANRILVYCMLGGRSSQASQILADNGFPYVFNMLGGIASWIVNGHPVYVRYSSLQVAVNGAAKGDTLLVSSGTYHEDLVVNRTMALVGENRDLTIIDGDGTGNILRVISDNVSVSGFSVRNGVCGFYVSACNGTTINNVKVAYDSVRSEGICLHDCWYAHIYGNTIENASRGIVLSNSCINVISNNVISRRNGCGLYLTLSCNNTLDSNAVFEGIGADGKGVGLEYSNQNLIFNNTVFDNGGIGLQSESSNCNLIYHNNMVNNSLNAYNHNSSNVWDTGYPSGGNYWSNFAGIDGNEDGIGDSPYVIDESNTDNYPLMNLFMEGDVNHDGRVNIFDVVKVCGAYGARPADPKWNVNVDIAEPYRVIDIFDVVKVCRNYGKTRLYP